MATTYESSTTATSSSDGIGLDKTYLKSWNGILKIVECVLDILAFICASIWIHWGSYGGGWVQFVTMSAFITTLLLYGFHLFRIIYKLPGPWGIILLVYYMLYSLMMLISAIVSASKGHYHASVGATAELIYYVLYSLMMLIAAVVCAARGHWHSSIGAAAFFCFAATACYVADTFLLFRAWQDGRAGGSSNATTTTTTTEHTTYETKTQY